MADSQRLTEGSGSLPHIPSDPAWKMLWEADCKLQAPFINVEQNNVLKGKEGMIDETRSNSIKKIFYTIVFHDKTCLFYSELIWPVRL